MYKRQDLSSQGQAGLDLDVYDLVTDSVRDVKSLSGGESFMAALSMALGLADIIQNTAEMCIRDRFTQIAMIAQGDFLRLLHAESKERKKIFSKIFQTQIYRDVQEQLKEQGKALYIQLKENEADIRREMERVDADGSKVQKVWEDLISQEMPSAEAVTETLGRICLLYTSRCV